MNVNASIVDQRISGIIEEYGESILAGMDLNAKKSAAFVLFCMSTALDITMEEACELLTEGGNDAGVDGLHIGEADDGEFTVTLFQGKYKIKNLDGEANFPENGVQKAVNTVATLFDPLKEVELNEKIKPRIEEIRSLIRDGYIPNVRFILCNNGAKWNAQAQNWIDQSGFRDDQVEWIHFNHDRIVAVMQRKKAVDDSFRLTGKALVEDFDYRRVLVGKAPVAEIAELFTRHGDLLLERNIRRYLGLHASRVNSAIHGTLVDKEKRGNFYFFNNGITMICKKFRHNALQGESYQLKVEGMQIINGGQTCKTIQQMLAKNGDLSDYEDVHVLVRLYELADNDKDFVRDITYATNSQNPVDMRDLRSNDEYQRQLELGMDELGYTYKRQREEGGYGSKVVTSAAVAESVLAIWRLDPHMAKFRRKEHFGSLYEYIFKDLHAAEALLAVVIFRYVENQRKNPRTDIPPDFLPYASHYLAMLIGFFLLIETHLKLDEITHINYPGMADIFEKQKGQYYSRALQLLSKAVQNLYGNRPVSLQQLAATFRRGDLLDWISKHLPSKHPDADS